MPVYTYRCEKCKAEITITHSIKEDPEILCDPCKTEDGFEHIMERLITSAPMIKFNGTGFTQKARV